MTGTPRVNGIRNRGLLRDAGTHHLLGRREGISIKPPTNTATSGNSSRSAAKAEDVYGYPSLRAEYPAVQEIGRRRALPSRPDQVRGWMAPPLSKGLSKEWIPAVGGQCLL
jgi:hypothetical protein